MRFGKLITITKYFVNKRVMMMLLLVFSMGSHVYSSSFTVTESFTQLYFGPVFEDGTYAECPVEGSKNVKSIFDLDLRFGKSNMVRLLGHFLYQEHFPVTVEFNLLPVKREAGVYCHWQIHSEVFTQTSDSLLKDNKGDYVLYSKKISHINVTVGDKVVTIPVGNSITIFNDERLRDKALKLTNIAPVALKKIGNEGGDRPKDAGMSSAGISEELWLAMELGQYKGNETVKAFFNVLVNNALTDQQIKDSLKAIDPKAVYKPVRHKKFATALGKISNSTWKEGVYIFSFQGPGGLHIAVFDKNLQILAHAKGWEDVGGAEVLDNHSDIYLTGSWINSQKPGYVTARSTISMQYGLTSWEVIGLTTQNDFSHMKKVFKRSELFDVIGKCNTLDKKATAPVPAKTTTPHTAKAPAPAKTTTRVGHPPVEAPRPPAEAPKSPPAKAPAPHTEEVPPPHKAEVPKSPPAKAPAPHTAKAPAPAKTTTPAPPAKAPSSTTPSTDIDGLGI